MKNIYTSDTYILTLSLFMTNTQKSHQAHEVDTHASLQDTDKIHDLGTHEAEEHTDSSTPGFENEIAELKEKLARSQADYQNLVMRTERDRLEMIAYQASKMLLPLLTQIDNLDRAIAIKDGVSDDAFVDGVRAVQAGLVKYLESQGVHTFDSVGSEVDPDRHDVLSQADGAEGIIVSEFERGYMIGDKILRHAKVVVGNGSV